jgi:hypothetical protein
LIFLLTDFYYKNFNKIERYSFDGNSIASTVFDYIKNKLNLALIGSTQYNVEITGDIICREYELAKIFIASGCNLNTYQLAKLFKEIGVAIFDLGQIKHELILLELKEILPQLSCFTYGATFIK